MGWLSWQQEETLSIWTITVAMETKFLFSINNLAGKCVSIKSFNVQSSAKDLGAILSSRDGLLNFFRLQLCDFALDTHRFEGTVRSSSSNPGLNKLFKQPVS